MVDRSHVASQDHLATITASTPNGSHAAFQAAIDAIMTSTDAHLEFDLASFVDPAEAGLDVSDELPSDTYHVDAGEEMPPLEGDGKCPICEDQ